MTLDLIVRRQNDPRSYPVVCELTGRSVFGREITSPVRLEGSEISREHFALTLQADGVYLEDLSANGTLVNGDAVPRGRLRKLREGDVMEVPGYELEWRKTPAPQAQQQTEPIEPQFPPEVKTEKTGSVLAALVLTKWEIFICGVIAATLLLLVYYFAS